MAQNGGVKGGLDPHSTAGAPSSQLMQDQQHHPPPAISSTGEPASRGVPAQQRSVLFLSIGQSQAVRQ